MSWIVASRRRYGASRVIRFYFRDPRVSHVTDSIATQAHNLKTTRSIDIRRVFEVPALLAHRQIDGIQVYHEGEL